MKNTKKLIIIIGLSISLMSLVACMGNSLDNKSSNNVMSEDEFDKLPEEKKDDELDKILARYRKERKKNIEQKNGLTYTVSPDIEIPGEFKYNEPDFDAKELRKAYEIVEDYLKNTLNIDPLNKNGFPIYNANIDPRMNAIYNEEDKGVAQGYSNENIFICEYEEKDDIYKYLILVRESKDSPWKVTHNGNSYKQK